MAGSGPEAKRQPEPSDPDLAAAFHRVADLLEDQLDSLAADLTDAYGTTSGIRSDDRRAPQR